MDRVGSLSDGRRRPPAREEALEHEIDPAALALHELQIVEDAREAIVATPAFVKDVLWCHTERKTPGVHDFEPIWMQVQEDVASLGVWPVPRSEGVPTRRTPRFVRVPPLDSP